MIIATYFKLIRWKNLLLITYLYILIKYLLFKTLGTETYLNNFQFLLLLIAVICITAAGYIINDIYDVKTDLINKPSKVIISKFISHEKGLQWYKITNVIGIILGVGLSINIEKPTAAFIFLSTSLLLYFYAKKLKSLPIIGNLTVSVLTAFSVLLLPLFEFNFLIKSEIQQSIFKLVCLLAIFAFFLNLIREIIKDIEDIDGDYSLKMNTLPILIGRYRSKLFAAGLCLFPLLLLVYIITNYSNTYTLTVLYLLFFTFIPLLYTMLKIRSIKSKKEFHKISNYLKAIMFLGVNALLIFSIFQP
jgi:4-hydroxybenzoate polyprenyltransferase